MHNEVGFLRVKPGTSTLAFTIAQNSGMHVAVSDVQTNKQTNLISNQIETKLKPKCKEMYGHQ